MKANEAPEKVYLSDFTDTTEAVFYVKKDNTKKTDIEYIRTDAFIEKACEWMSTHLPMQYDGLSDYTKEFHKAMEE